MHHGRNEKGRMKTMDRLRERTVATMFEGTTSDTLRSCVARISPEILIAPLSPPPPALLLSRFISVQGSARLPSSLSNAACCPLDAPTLARIQLQTANARDSKQRGVVRSRDSRDRPSARATIATTLETESRVDRSRARRVEKNPPIQKPARSPRFCSGSSVSLATCQAARLSAPIFTSP